MFEYLFSKKYCEFIYITLNSHEKTTTCFMSNLTTIGAMVLKKKLFEVV